MTVAYVLVGLVALGGVTMTFQNVRAPELGVSDGRLAPVPRSPNAVSTQTDDASKRVDPLPMVTHDAADGATTFDLEESRARVRAAVAAYGGGRIVVDEPTYMRVLFTTSRMRFRDDAEFAFDLPAGVIHFRSASRVGMGDMGLNRQRYEALRTAYLSDER